jgi:hypothetical protein
LTNVDILTVTVTAALVAIVTFSLVFLLVRRRLAISPQPATAVDKKLMMSEVILLMLEKLDPPKDRVRFVADDGDWYRDPMFSSIITLLANQGASGQIRLRNPSPPAIRWYEDRGLRFGGDFSSKSDLKAMFIGDKVGMFVLKKGGHYYSVKSDDAGFLQRLISLYETPSPEADSTFEKQIEEMLSAKV